MSKRIKPLHDRVLVKRTENEQKTVGGIIIPETAQEKMFWGVVIEVGPGRRTPEGTLQAMAVKVGDRVIFGKYTGTEFSLDNEEFLILREDEILGIIEQ